MDAAVKRWTWLAVVVYVLLLATGIAASYLARRQVLASFGTAQDREAWEDWREAARQQDGTESTVQRRVPKSPEPPALVLLRDHFATCIAGAIFLTTVLYWSTVFFIRGAFFGPQFEISRE